MATARITAQALEKLQKQAKAAGKGFYAWDDTVSGFGCWVSPRAVSWCVQGRPGGKAGKSKRVTFKAASIDEARRKAKRLLTDLSEGIDIAQRKREQRTEIATADDIPRLGEAADKFIRHNRKPGRYWDEVEKRFNNEIIPALGKSTRIDRITKAQLRSLIEAKQDAGHKGGARLLFAALNPFFKWCASRYDIASPLESIERPKPLKARARVLADHEVKALWDATAALPLFGPFYRLLLLTAQRREEVGAMQWSELDLAAATWTIPKERTKNGKEHLVHLSPQALAVINGLRHNAGALQRIEGCPFLFSTTHETPISGYGKAKARLDELMTAELKKIEKKLPLWRVHDLRRTAASGMAKLGFQPHIVERVLNHISGAQGGLVGVYQRHEYLEERKRAVEAWGAYVERLTSGAPGQNNVMHFRA